MTFLFGARLLAALRCCCCGALRLRCGGAGGCAGVVAAGGALLQLAAASSCCPRRASLGRQAAAPLARVALLLRARRGRRRTRSYLPLAAPWGHRAAAAASDERCSVHRCFMLNSPSSSWLPAASRSRPVRRRRDTTSDCTAAAFLLLLPTITLSFIVCFVSLLVKGRALRLRPPNAAAHRSLGSVTK